MKRLFSGLWRHPDFMKLWIGQTVSEFGSRISRGGIPLVAVIFLNATPAQMGILTAVSALPILLFGLVAGVWVDRLRRRPVMIFADISRLILLLSIPFAALTGTLSMGLIIVVTALLGILSLVFEIAYRAYLPSLIQREDLIEGNSKLATTDSLAEIGGPAITGFLVQAIGAPLSILFDSLSFVFSASCFAMIRKPESPPAPRTAQDSMLREIIEGGRVIAGNPVLRALVVGAGIRAFFGNFYAVLYDIYIIRELGMTPAALGIIIASGGIGALIGTFLSSWIPRRIGLGRTLILTLLFSGFTGLLTPLAGGPTWLAMTMLIISQIVGDACYAIYGINEISLRQMIVPDRLLGRANASVGFLENGVAPIGAIVGGVLASVMGARLTLLIAVIGTLSRSIWMVFSAVKDVEVPEAQTVTIG